MLISLVADFTVFVRSSPEEVAVWGEWSKPYDCSVTCSEGVGYKRRVCKSQKTGKTLPNIRCYGGAATELALCNLGPCPGEWIGHNRPLGSCIVCDIPEVFSFKRQSRVTTNDITYTTVSEVLMMNRPNESCVCMWFTILVVLRGTAQ